MQRALVVNTKPWVSTALVEPVQKTLPRMLQLLASVNARLGSSETITPHILKAQRWPVQVH